MPRRTLPLLTALLLLAVPHPAAAQAPAPANDTPITSTQKTVNIDTTNAALNTVISLLEREAGIRIKVQGDPEAYKPVTVHLEATSLARALQAIALSAGGVIEGGSHGNYVLHPSGVKALLSGRAIPPTTQVSLKVEFVTASIAGVDNLGVNFDLIPLPDPVTIPGTPADARHSFLQCATGEPASQLYRTLTRTRGHLVSAPLVATPSGVAATVSVDGRVPDGPLNAPTNTVPLGAVRFPQIAHPLYIQGTLTLTPHVHPDGTVSLELLPPTGNKTVTLRAVHGGDTLVFIATTVQPGGLFRNRVKIPVGDELLVFVTPTIVGEGGDHAPVNAAGGQSVTVTL